MIVIVHNREEINRMQTEKNSVEKCNLETMESLSQFERLSVQLNDRYGNLMKQHAETCENNAQETEKMSALQLALVCYSTFVTLTKNKSENGIRS